MQVYNSAIIIKILLYATIKQVETVVFKILKINHLIIAK